MTSVKLEKYKIQQIKSRLLGRMLEFVVGDITKIMI